MKIAVIVSILMAAIGGLGFYTWKRNQVIFIELGVACIEANRKGAYGPPLVQRCNCLSRKIEEQTYFAEKMFYTATFQPTVSIATKSKVDFAVKECNRIKNSPVDWFVAD